MIPLEIVTFRKKLISWGYQHYRVFPWRLTNDPYSILIAEVMLHRTRASQVQAVYERFIVRYPNPYALSKAKLEELDELLYPLGLRWRVPLLHEMAAELVEKFSGKVPFETSSLHSLPGVSDYIASAVRCFAWNLPDSIIDTNTVRITGRVFGLEIKPSSRRNAHFRERLESMVDPEAPRDYNYALLDLGALICTKVRKPDCQVCPILEYCEYGQRVCA